MRLKWLGHSSLLFYDNDIQILVDPFITGNPTAAVKIEELDPDYIIITHGHGDHIGDCVEIAKNSGAVVIANFEICNWLASKGVENTHPMNTGGSFEFDFGRFKQTIAHHSSGLPDGSDGGNPSGAIFFFKEKTVYFASDTSLFLDMQLIGEEGIDTAILPIGDNFTMGPDDAVKAVGLIKPGIVIPVHYSTFDVIKQNPLDFKEKVEAEYPETKVCILCVGDETEL